MFPGLALQTHFHQPQSIVFPTNLCGSWQKRPSFQNMSWPEIEDLDGPIAQRSAGAEIEEVHANETQDLQFPHHARKSVQPKQFRSRPCSTQNAKRVDQQDPGCDGHLDQLQ